MVWTVLGAVTGVAAVFIIPAIVLFVRLMVRGKGIEDKLEEVAKDLRDIVEDKDKVHHEMYRQMREDRNATDRRLRWLEENLWSKKK